LWIGDSEVEAGALIHRVSLERDSITRVSGAEKRTAEVYAETVPARVTFLTGREFWQGQQQNSSITARVDLRYRADVRPQHRVLYGNWVLDIRAVLPDETTRCSVTLMCEARANG
jgi:SPP1 family predicted phage head-tail adaptor